MTAPSVARALAFAGTHDPEDIALGVAEGRFQEWSAGDSQIVTEILQTPKRRTVHFFLAEGHMPELEAMVPGILAWAKSVGCTHASLVGREGWRRVPWLLQDGWQFRHVVMEREL